MKKNIVAILAFCAGLASAAGLGINISLPERGGTFVDIARENYRWTAVGTGAALTSADVDSLGWPAVNANFVLDNRPVAEWASSIDDPDVYRIDLRGVYKCSFKGRASVRSVIRGTVQAMAYDSAQNRSTFDFAVTDPPGAGHGFFILEFTQTRRTAQSAPGTGFTDFKMHRPGYPLDSPKLFTDEFLSALTGINFSAVRYMVFTVTNGMDPDYPGTYDWSHRKHPGDASQAPIAPLNKTDGASWETVLALSNTVKKDPWINVPISATHDYIARLAELFRDSLDPALNLYVESSNEVWNTAPGFEQSAYNKAQAQALGITEHQNHARRTVELASVFDSVFGAGNLNDRVRVVLCSHKPMLKWWVDPMLSYINTNYGPPRNHIWAIGCQTYFGGGADTGESVSKILADCHAEITDQIDETGQTNEAGRVQWIARAAAQGLSGGFVSYEGGPDHGGGSTVNIANRILAERDLLMGGLLKFNFDTAFLAIGGELAMQFTLSSGYNRYGCWGLTDDISIPERNYKYAALRSIVGGSSSEQGGAVNASPAFTVFPNPVSARARIAVHGLPRAARGIKAVICGIDGRVVDRLSGMTWNALRVPPGIYLVRVSAGGRTMTRRVVVAR